MEEKIEKRIADISKDVIEMLGEIAEKHNSESNILEGDSEESLNEVSTTEVTQGEFCVCGACVTCTNAATEGERVHIIKNGKNVEIDGLELLNINDISLAKPFSICDGNGSCNVSKETIFNQKWVDGRMDRNKDGGKETLSCEESYMLCLTGPGLIFFVSAGQELKDYVMLMEPQYMKLFKMLDLLKRLEIGDIDNPGNENYEYDEKLEEMVIGIQNAKDGYITIGYGHAIQTDDDAEKYGLNALRSISGFETFKFSFEYSEDQINPNGDLPEEEIQRRKKEIKDKRIEEIDKAIEALNEYYSKNGQRNPAKLTPFEAEQIMMEEVKKKYDFVVELIGDGYIDKFSDDELNAITSVLYNGNKPKNKESLSYNFIHTHVPEEGTEVSEEKEDLKNKEDILNILHKAENNNWYDEGLLRRRLMEVNVFCNGNYKFYDGNEFEQLKRDTGYWKGEE